MNLNSMEMPKEMPNKEEQLKALKKQIEVLEEQIKLFNLPGNLPEGESFLPDHLTEDQKREIIKIREILRVLKNRSNFLENPNEIK